MRYGIVVLLACVLGLYLGRERVRQGKEYKTRQRDAIIRHIAEKLR